MLSSVFLFSIFKSVRGNWVYFFFHKHPPPPSYCLAQNFSNVVFAKLEKKKLGKGIKKNKNTWPICFNYYLIIKNWVGGGGFNSCKYNIYPCSNLNFWFVLSKGYMRFDKLSLHYTPKKFCAYTFIEMCNLQLFYLITFFVLTVLI